MKQKKGLTNSIAWLMVLQRPSRMKINLEGHYFKPDHDYFKQEDLTSWKTCPPRAENFLGHFINRFVQACPLVPPSPCLLVSILPVSLSFRSLLQVIPHHFRNIILNLRPGLSLKAEGSFTFIGFFKISNCMRDAYGQHLTGIF